MKIYIVKTPVGYCIMAIKIGFIKFLVEPFRYKLNANIDIKKPLVEAHQSIWKLRRKNMKIIVKPKSRKINQQQFEEILSQLGLIAVILSYQTFGFNWITKLILIKFGIDTYCAIRLAYKSVFKKQ